MQLSSNLESWQTHQSKEVTICIKNQALSLHSLVLLLCTLFTHRNSYRHFYPAAPIYDNTSGCIETSLIQTEPLLSGYCSLSPRMEESVALHCLANRSWGWERCLAESLTSLGLEIMATQSLSRNDLISALRSKKEPGCAPNGCGEERCDRARNCWNCT